MKYWLSFLLIFMPNWIKLPVYRKVYGYKIGNGVKIGFSWIFVHEMEISGDVIIGHLNRFKNIPKVIIGKYSVIGSQNTFTSTWEFTNPLGITIRNNNPCLLIGDHCGITNRHYFDIQDQFIIGSYVTIAGHRSNFFTHFINVTDCVQSTKPITIGNYCMIGSGVNFVPGSIIPNYCIVGMGSVVTKPFFKEYILVGGNPARLIKILSPSSNYFNRTYGYISSFSDPPFKYFD